MRHSVESAGPEFLKSLQANAVAPLAENAKQAGEAMNELVTRRLGAYRNLPQQAAACRSPQEIARAQMEFWTAARADYAELITTMARVCAPPAFAAMLANEHDDHDDHPSPSGARGKPNRRNGR